MHVDRRSSWGAVLCASLVLGPLSVAEAKTFYKVDFEGGDTSASVGTSAKEEQNGTVTAVPNPHPDATNSSAMVGRVQVIKATSKTRAELRSQRLPTDEKTYRYRWSSYYPANMLNGVNVSWLVTTQWKTWPCQVCDPIYDPAICGGCGGIFNEANMPNKTTWHFRWRAEPDCHDHSETIAFGRWVRFEMLVYWTKTSNGYVRLWRDGKLVKSLNNIRTLFTSFVNGQCDMYWAMGLYSAWSGTPNTISAYIDDIEISDDVTPPVQDAGVPLPDAAVPDVAVPDAAAVPDVAVPDAAAPDVAVPDAAARDVAARDVAVPDAAGKDAKLPDAAGKDAAVPDAAASDAAAKDAAVPDAAGESTSLDGGCAAGGLPAGGFLISLLLLAFACRRARGSSS